MNTKATKCVGVILIFIYTGLYLKTQAMKETITAYKAGIWGFISILGVTCVVGGGRWSSIVFKNNFMNSSTPASAIGPLELRYGLQIYMILPCAISSGVVMVITSFLIFVCFFSETVVRRCSIKKVCILCKKGAFLIISNIYNGFKSLTIFIKKLHHRCLTVFWIRLSCFWLLLCFIDYFNRDAVLRKRCSENMQ